MQHQTFPHESRDITVCISLCPKCWDQFLYISADLLIPQGRLLPHNYVRVSVTCCQYDLHRRHYRSNFPKNQQHHNHFYCIFPKVSTTETNFQKVWVTLILKLLLTLGVSHTKTILMTAPITREGPQTNGGMM